jgi:hypothetical protein
MPYLNLINNMNLINYKKKEHTNIVYPYMKQKKPLLS